MADFTKFIEENSHIKEYFEEFPKKLMMLVKQVI